jgi:hypothetical protein
MQLQNSPYIYHVYHVIISHQKQNSDISLQLRYLLSRAPRASFIDFTRIYHVFVYHDILPCHLLPLSV